MISPVAIHSLSVGFFEKFIPAYVSLLKMYCEPSRDNTNVSGASCLYKTVDRLHTVPSVRVPH